MRFKAAPEPKRLIVMTVGGYAALIALCWSVWWYSGDMRQQRFSSTALERAAEGNDAGSVRALVRLRQLNPARASFIEAVKLEHGDEPPSDARNARIVSLLRQAIDDRKVSLSARAMLGRYLLQSEALRRPGEKPVEMLRDAAREGNPMAAQTLAQALLEGTVAGDNEDIDRYFRLASRTNASAARTLLEAYQSGRLQPSSRNAPQDLQRRIFALDLENAEEGQVTAMVRVADALLRQGGQAKEAEGRKWYERAVEAGSTTARLRLVALLRRDPNIANAAERAHKLMLEAASAGSRQALLELGIDFFNGRGVPRDVRRARLIFSQLAKIGASETALFYLSDIYLTGKGVPRNLPLGMTYLQRAAQAGHASSAYHMGLIYRQGLYGHAADPQQSLYWIEKAARAGRLQAMVEMARTYDRGVGVDKDARQAFFWANRAVGRGSAAPDILILVAEGYADGEYIPRDVRRAEKMLIAAIEQGNPTAMLRLGQLYFSFQDARAQNAAVGWLRRASQLGQSYAMVELGRAYASGAGVEIDPVKAVYYFRSAAVAGNADGMIEYGRSSATGYGLVQNYTTAARWYLRAAEAGSPQGMVSYASALERGEGLPRSASAALTWIERAATTGDAEGIYWLGVYLLDGRGGKRDPQRAEVLLQLAASKKFAPARAMLARLRGEITA